jgi:hypothetical protein
LLLPEAGEEAAGLVLDKLVVALRHATHGRGPATISSSASTTAGGVGCSKSIWRAPTSDSKSSRLCLITRTRSHSQTSSFIIRPAGAENFRRGAD